MNLDAEPSNCYQFIHEILRMNTKHNPFFFFCKMVEGNSKEKKRERIKREGKVNLLRSTFPLFLAVCTFLFASLQLDHSNTVELQNIYPTQIILVNFVINTIS